MLPAEVSLDWQKLRGEVCCLRGKLWLSGSRRQLDAISLYPGMQEADTATEQGDSVWRLVQGQLPKSHLSMNTRSPSCQMTKRPLQISVTHQVQRFNFLTRPCVGKCMTI